MQHCNIQDATILHESRTVQEYAWNIAKTNLYTTFHIVYDGIYVYIGYTRRPTFLHMTQYTEGRENNLS